MRWRARYERFSTHLKRVVEQATAGNSRAAVSALDLPGSEWTGGGGRWAYSHPPRYQSSLSIPQAHP